jgi:hypothetical protein
MSLDRNMYAWRQRYDNAVSGHDTTIQDEHIASLVDDALHETMAIFREGDCPLPGDDRIENVATLLFKVAAEAAETSNAN